MKSTFLAVAAGSLIGSAAAASLHERHAGFHNRRHNYGYGSEPPMGTGYSPKSYGTGAYPPLATGAHSPSAPSCGCTTFVTTWYGKPTLVAPVESTSTKVVYITPSPVESTSTKAVYVTPSPVESTSTKAAYVTPSPVKSTSTKVVYVTPSPVQYTTKSEYVPTPVVTTCETPGTYTFPGSTVTLTQTTTVCYPTTTHLTPGTHTYGGVTTSVLTSTTVTCPYATVETSATYVTSVIKTTTYVCPSAGEYTIVPHSTTTVTRDTTVVYPIPTTYVPGTYTHKEETVTVTKTSEIYVCPYETLSSSTSVHVVASPDTTSTVVYNTKSVSYEHVASSSTPVYNTKPVTYAPVASSSTPVYHTKPASYEHVASASTSAYSVSHSTHQTYAPKATGGSSSISTNGNQWAMTYTPYTPDGQCKTAQEVMSDIEIIHSKGFTTVRLYAPDCDGLVNVGAACQAKGVKMIVGIYIDNTGISSCSEQVDEIITWGKDKWSIVEMIVVGNEAIFNNFASASELSSFILEVKGRLKSAGYTGPVTTTEPLNILQEYAGELCGAIDVVAANIQSFFNSNTCASDAGKFVAGQLDLVAAACPGKTAYNLESGWPKAGSANGAAVPGYSEQKEAIMSILEHAGSRSVIFSYQDDTWKTAGSFNVEQHFGCVDLF